MTKQTYKLTPDEKLEVARLYLEGHKMDYIASLFGIARSAVAYTARCAGAPYRHPITRRSHATKN